MLRLRVASRPMARLPRRTPNLISRALHSRASSSVQKCTRRPRLKALNAAAFYRPHTRLYSDEAQARILEDGLPLQNSGPTTATLLAYAAAHWPAPSVLPPRWSANWRDWDYLLTLFAFSPYFLRLPQIEMLVNVKYGIPGEVRPIMYCDGAGKGKDKEGDWVLLSAEIPAEAMEDLEPSEAQPEEAGVGEDGAGYVFLLNCRTFDIWTARRARRRRVLIVRPPSLPSPSPKTSPCPNSPPDPAGESALARILARDASVIPLLESDFLGYAPRPTERAEELLSADAAHAAHKAKWKDAIERVREYVKEMEAELRGSEEEVGDLRAVERGGGRGS
ncbi:hypothetical protein MVEN_00932000 [Mycena venus]|uniref:Uncharacterized protein n=1 Tax=Mycena venus TaxID=2733690 RepID=A0A8H6Y827_9AGAR|nr:hypothetical protein MVEN_00932000 [Mycena venus]